MRIKWLSIIRVIGLIFVLLYHFFIKYFPGGFLGVDLFFTLSGYLTTAIFIDEYGKKNSINLHHFSTRRLYRILPPLVLCLIITTPLALFIRDDFLARIGQQITAALGFMTNIYEILAGGGYENQFTPHLFLHTWSLALEVHYYVLWGIIVWILSRIAKTIGQLRGLIFLTAGTLFLLTFLTMSITSFFVTSYSTIYFATWTHIFPFFLGSLLAPIAGMHCTTVAFQRICQNWTFPKAIRLFAVGLSVELLLLFTFKFDSIWTYLFGFLLSSIATLIMIYAARILHEKTPTIQEPAFLSYLANISYNLYLFHWPLYIIFSQLLDNTLASTLTLVLSIILSSLSFYLIEPMITGNNPALKHRFIHFQTYSKSIVKIGTVLAIPTILVCLLSPKLGKLEQQLLIDGLHQADARMIQTKTLAERGKASSYEVVKGIMVIGDSVTLHATEQIKTILPDALVDAQGSRNTTQAFETLKTNIESGTLVENVVIATGTNIVYNYEEEINNIIDILPNGYRLIFVTPYDGNYQQYDNPIAEKHAQYLKSLVKKYNFITIADWNTVAKENPQLWVGTDNIHFGGTSTTRLEGATLFAQTISDALKKAANSPVKNIVKN